MMFMVSFDVVSGKDAMPRQIPDVKADSAGFTARTLYACLFVPSILAHFEFELGIEGKEAVLRKAFPNADPAYIESVISDN